MNVRIYSSPLPSAKTNSLKNSSNRKVSDKYVNNNDLKANSQSYYFDNIQGQILNITKTTKKQEDIVISFLKSFKDIIEQNNFDITTIKGVKSNDDEICIYRKSKEGISMIAIDEDGDGFYNFTGNKDGIETIFFENENPNIQTITSKFFSK
jgi:hypothetical protein